MGCATESFCWFKPQQVNIFSARGGATWAEPICVERSCGQPLSARDSSDEKLRGSVGHGDAWESAAEGTRRSAAGLADDGGRSSMRRHAGGLIRLAPLPCRSQSRAMRSSEEAGFADIRKTHPCATTTLHLDVLPSTQSLSSPIPCEKSHVRIGMGASGRLLRAVLRTRRRSAVVQ